MIPSLKKPVGVLCGGPSGEREISLKSGQAIHEALLSLGLPSLLLELSRRPSEIPGQIIRAPMACAFIALHGAFGEDGKIQTLLGRLRIPYTGSRPTACRLGMDKWGSRGRWTRKGVPVPETVRVNLPGRLPGLGGLRFPVVVKPQAQGSSLGISLVDRPRNLRRAIREAASFGGGVLIEEYLAGSEFTVGILEDKALPVVQVVPKRRFYDFTAKYTQGQTDYRVPAPIPAPQARRAQRLALRAHRALGCRSFCRVDMIWVKDRGPVLLELNTMPGMTPLSLLPKAARVSGIDFAQLCLRMLASAW
ncbi:MAG: D-alanine--D-alanine ligase [Candidatus Omnitrophica bacterium]|nr:D-alanine--D-alanine ligase [Candidatus Omnitrophota bacterium]